MLWTLLALVFVVAILFQLLRKVVQPKIVEYDFLDSNVSSSGHHFVTIATDVHGQYCSLCENGVQTGMQCEYCGVLVDTVLCLRLLAGTMSCKTIPHLTDNDITHHWIRGNLPSSSVCFSCDEMCGDGVGLIDYRCSLCQITVHADCKFSIGERCNLGANRDFIIPPDCINWHKGGYRRKRQLIIDAISMPKKESFSSWTPLFVIVNPKSGGAEGAAVLKTFRYFLHPVQVINIEQVSVGSALRWTDTHPEIDYLVLVAGGDGTVSLILNSLEVLRKRPPVAVLPLGTGNDLSRVLGWGSGHSGEIDFGQVCSSLRESKIVKLDRWTVEITHRRRFGVRPKNKHLRMINYISIGVDACVTYGTLLIVL
ncbi:hypothetical protein AB6A40_003684 [Gnathostoma spinigerum]|uniref:Diacylglycerol kinase (ATP) n=1 Tax=Gnathostoma spinigerum TaxID=75299 RepID=A0ABD6EBF7_9BILA